jgi:hypothetical protein
MGASAGGTAGAAAAAAIANAIKASGAIVKVDPNDFRKIMAKMDAPLVVRAEGGFLSRKYRYLTAYKGLIFYTISPSELPFGSGVEMILAEKIWIPS